MAINFIKNGIDTSDANATENDIIKGKSAYVNDEKINGNIQVNKKTIIAGNTHSFDKNIHILDYLVDKGIVILQKSSTPQNSIIIAKYDINTGLIDEENYLTINVSQINTSAKYPLTNIYTAKFATLPIIENVYNICLTGAVNDFDWRTYAIIRVDVENLLIYEDETYTDILTVAVTDAWGGQPNMLYDLRAFNNTTDRFISYPIFARRQGSVLGYQFAFDIVANSTKITGTQLEDIENFTSLRSLAVSRSGDYYAINNINENEAIYNSQNVQVSRGSLPIVHFITVDSDEEYVFYNKKLYKKENNFTTLVKDFSDVLPTGDTYETINNTLIIINDDNIETWYLTKDTNENLTFVKSASFEYEITTNSTNDYIRFLQYPELQNDYFLLGNVNTNMIYCLEITPIKCDIIRKGITFYNPALTNTEADKVIAGTKFIGNNGIEEGTFEEIDTSDANATASDIVNGKTAYANGEKITGIIEDRSNNTLSSNVTEVNIYDPWAYLKGTPLIANDVKVSTNTIISSEILTSTLAENIGLTADKIKAGETILGITGTYTGETEPTE